MKHLSKKPVTTNKKMLFVVLFLSAIMLFLLLIPGKYWSREFNEDCIEYCNSDKDSNLGNTLIKNIDCSAPVDGYFVNCFGYNKKVNCNSVKKCFLECENICFGVVNGSPTAPNFLSAKLIFLKSFFAGN